MSTSNSIANSVQRSSPGPATANSITSSSDTTQTHSALAMVSALSSEDNSGKGRAASHSNDSATPQNGQIRRRRRKLTPQEMAEYSMKRKFGVCDECRRRKVKCEYTGCPPFSQSEMTITEGSISNNANPVNESSQLLVPFPESTPSRSPRLGSDIGSLFQQPGHQQSGFLDKVLSSGHAQYTQVHRPSNIRSTNANGSLPITSHTIPPTSPSARVQDPLSPPEQGLRFAYLNEQGHNARVASPVDSSNHRFWAQRPTLEQTVIPQSGYPPPASPSQTTYTNNRFESSQINTATYHPRNSYSDADISEADNRATHPSA